MRTGAIRSLAVIGAMGALTLGGFAASGAASAGSDDAACFLAAINSARGANGVGALATDGALALIAQTWTGTMAAAGQISHNLNLPNLAPDGWMNLGENVGVGPSCDALAQAFMNSPEHRANILSPKYSTVGVGVVVTADGTMYVTEDFMGTGSQAPAPAPQPAPAPVTAPAPAPAHTTAPAPKPAAPAPVHTTTPAHTTAPAPRAAVAAVPPAPSPSAVPAPSPSAIPAPSPSAIPAPDPVVPSAQPIVAPDPAPAPAKHAAHPAHASTRPKHVHHKGGVLHAIGSLLAHIF